MSLLLWHRRVPASDASHSSEKFSPRFNKPTFRECFEVHKKCSDKFKLGIINNKSWHFLTVRYGCVVRGWDSLVVSHSPMNDSRSASARLSPLSRVCLFSSHCSHPPPVCCASPRDYHDNHPRTHNFDTSTQFHLFPPPKGCNQRGVWSANESPV